MRALCRVKARLIEAYRLYQLWRHNRRIMIRIALLNAQRYTNLGIRCDEQSRLDEDLVETPDMILNPFRRYRMATERIHNADQG